MYNKQFVKVTAFGNLSGVDIFNWSLNLSTLLPADSAAAAALLMDNEGVRTQIVNLIRNQHSSTAGSAPIALLEGVKFAWIGEDGKYVEDAITANFVPVAGGFTEDSTPTAFTGAAISLTGFIARNDAGRGRYYPPSNAYANSDGFYIGSARQTQLAESHAALISDINAALIEASSGLRVHIMSEKGSGASQEVQSVRVGSVLDVQRRRKNRAYETYVNRNIS